MIVPFREGMRRLGFVEHQNLEIEYRYAEGHAERLPAMVADLVAQHVEVIVASGSDAVMAAHSGHQATPVVFFSADPNSYGVKLSFSHPEDGVTGTALMYDVLVAKWVQLMH